MSEEEKIAEIVHEGAEKERCEYQAPLEGWINKEKVFAEAWKETNAPPSFLNGGRGTLELLLCCKPSTRPTTIWGVECCGELTQEQATAAASAIQWLGTNCGWCWLEEAVEKCGYDLVRRKK